MHLSNFKEADKLMKRFVLLLPSAIKPPTEMPYLTLRNDKVRLMQTIRALRYWSRYQDRDDFEFKVIVGDNTGSANLIREKAQKYFSEDNLIVMDVPIPDPQTIARGKGAAETSSMLFMLNNFEFLNTDYVGKMTGRQTCANAIDLFLSLERLPNFSAWPRPDLKTVDSRFYIGSAEYLKQILPIIYSETDDVRGLFVEELYATYGIWGNREGFELFRHEPSILGQAGTTGTKLSSFSEANMVATVVKMRNWLRAHLTFIQPSYKRKK